VSISGLVEAALAPMGALYGAVGAARAAAYRRGWFACTRLAGPVISVGNLSVGGTGKTPLVARLAELLRQDGLPVSILSRGYGGNHRGTALVVSDGQSVLASALVAGDEAVMLARRLPEVVVAIGPRRDRVGLFVEARYGARAHILDDGFQHLRLARDLDLLCLSGDDLHDRPLPAGRLREFRSAAARADAVFVTDVDEQRFASLRDSTDVLRDRPVFRYSRRVLGFFEAADESPGCATDEPESAFLVSGIARPERFAADVRASGVDVLGHAAFPDHHRLSAPELDTVIAEAQRVGAAALVTTAKDWVRWPESYPPVRVLTLEIRAEIDDEQALRGQLRLVTGRMR